MRAKQFIKQGVAEGSLNEFAPNDDGEDRNHEYEVYQCNPEDQFEWIGGPIYKTDDIGKAHVIAHNLHKKHSNKAFMIWQERTEGSRGGYGIKDDEQGVAEGTIDEMALSTYKTMGDFSKPGPFKDPDYKLVTHPVHIQKVAAFFEKTPQDFRFFMSNLPRMRKYRESGQKSPEEIKQIFGDKNAAEILQNSENSITVIYLGNFGQNRVMMTAHTIAHRVGHAITATGRYNSMKASLEWNRLDDHFFKKLTAILSSYYGVSSKLTLPYKYDLEKQYLGLLYQIGTLKSSRERNLNNPYEFLYEMLAQYINTGQVTLKPLPTSAGYGRLVGWKTKSFERYLRINRDYYSDELLRQQVTDQLASEMSSLFSNLLDSCVGKIYVM